MHDESKRQRGQVGGQEQERVWHGKDMNTLTTGIGSNFLRRKRIKILEKIKLVSGECCMVPLTTLYTHINWCTPPCVFGVFGLKLNLTEV